MTQPFKNTLVSCFFLMIVLLGGVLFAAPGKVVALNGVSISSYTHKDGKWSSVRKAILNWSASVDVNGYYIALDQSPTTTPGGSLVTGATITYDNIPDGIWYFHVKAVASPAIPVAHFKLQIDKVQPDGFTITVDSENQPTNRTPKVTFESKDAMSGIDRHEVSIDGGTPFVHKSGDPLLKQRAGAHTIAVTAYDKAGNSREAQHTFTIEGIGAPFITKWTPHVNILRPVRFEGRSDPSDTIVVLFEGKEVDRFTARDRKSEDNGQMITWAYSYTDRLYPGLYTFSFYRIDAAGVDSEVTSDYLVKLHASAYILGNFAVAFSLLVVIFWGIIALLTLWIILLYRYRRHHHDGGHHHPHHHHRH